MKFALAIALTVGACVFLLAKAVTTRHAAVTIGYEIGRATNEQSRLEEEVKRLRIDRAALLDPQRLEPVALARGYRVPTTDEVVAVPASVAEARDGTP